MSEAMKESLSNMCVGHIGHRSQLLDGLQNSVYGERGPNSEPNLTGSPLFA